MKNVALLQSTKNESPKTPGGISKSLLTPCRRIGLSRNWKKAGPSPFVSPVPGSTQNKVDVKVEKKCTRKRKEPVSDNENKDLSENTPSTTNEDVLNADDSVITVPSKVCQDIDSTPTRHIALPHKKKSRLLADSEDMKSNYKSSLREVQFTLEKPEEIILCTEQRKEEPVKELIDSLTTTHQTPSSITKKHKPTKSNAKSSIIKDIIVKEDVDTSLCNNKEESQNKKSLKNLTTECVAVIQKKIFKTKEKDLLTVDKKERDIGNLHHCNKIVTTEDDKTVSQTLLYSDSDVPLCNLNKTVTENVKTNFEPQKQPEVINSIEDDDFTGTKIVTVAKLVHKNTSTSGLKSGKVKKQKLSKPKIQKNVKTPIDSKTASQNSYVDDDDFEFETKRTILIRKTYDKVAKPLKAKTTGSITEKDVDELKARIEMKKKVLLAKATTEDTKELRELIKKWQKGCQDALAELMDLMKKKCPDKKHMDYSEMLQMLKIPSNLVGYNSDDDCFYTPDDTSIVLSKFNDT